MSKYEGVDFKGKIVKLVELKDVNRIALNVYSPTCVPCIEEIPALNYMDNFIRKERLGKMYMVVDPYFIVEGSEDMSFQEVYLLAKNIMLGEVSKHSIKLDILIMKKPFEVLPEKGLITGTPETLLFKTNPLVLFYNFIGPISVEKDIENLQKNSKILFFKRQMGGT